MRRVSRWMVVVGAAAVMAGCGSSKGTTNQAASAAGTPTTAATATTGAAGSSGASTVAVGHTSLGSALVDSSGRTLYLFTKDTPGTSACIGGCASNWPALTTTGAPAVGSGLDASKVGTITRTDGSKQVTYAGHPLYRFAADGSAGDVKGEGVGGIWFVVGSDGAAIQPASTGSNGY